MDEMIYLQNELDDARREISYLEQELFEAQRTIADMEGVASANRAEIMRLRNVVNGCREEGIQRRCDALTDAGDWLVIWRVVGGYAHFLRTGTHDELFRRYPSAPARSRGPAFFSCNTFLYLQRSVRL